MAQGLKLKVRIIVKLCELCTYIAMYCICCIRTNIGGKLNLANCRAIAKFKFTNIFPIAYHS